MTERAVKMPSLVPGNWFGRVVEGGNAAQFVDSFGNLRLARAVTALTHLCHGASYRAGWWNRPDGTPIDNSEQVPVKLMLIVSEISEAMEGHRKGLMDDKLPHRPMIEVELADAMIRILDLAGALGLDLGGALVEKMRFNAHRADHKPENRAAAGGKAY